MELSREDKMIKQLCKTFKEGTDSYWLNTQRYIEAVSYTHLTLPTNSRV